MNILVTGCEGFIGTHLRRELEDAGHTVIGSDKGDHDLAEPGRAERLIRYHPVRPDYVVHLAARYGRLLCRDEPHQAVTDNVAATTELAAACADLGIPVLYASSSEVYGDQGTDLITERSPRRTPTTIYGLSKLWGEQGLQLYLPPDKTCIVRLNMLYGPEQRAGYGCCALATFIKKALDGEPFTVHRNTSRSYLYISDAVKALRLLIEGGHTGIFNCSNEEEYLPTQRLAEMVMAFTDGEHGGCTVTDPPPGIQIRHKNYSSAKLRNALDWQPEVSLQEGVRRTVEAQRKAPVPSYA